MNCLSFNTHQISGTGTRQPPTQNYLDKLFNLDFPNTYPNIFSPRSSSIGISMKMHETLSVCTVNLLSLIHHDSDEVVVDFIEDVLPLNVIRDQGDKSESDSGYPK